MSTKPSPDDENRIEAEAERFDLELFRGGIDPLRRLALVESFKDGLKAKHIREIAAVHLQTAEKAAALFGPDVAALALLEAALTFGTDKLGRQALIARIMAADDAAGADGEGTA